MKLEIIQDEKNPLLSRREVRFRVAHEGEATPKKAEVAKLLSAKLNLKPETMLIKHYTTRYGHNVSEGWCLAYESREAMEKAEPMKILNPKKRIGQVEESKEGEKSEAQGNKEE